MRSAPDDRWDDPDPQREDEAVREQRWNTFIDAIRARKQAHPDWDDEFESIQCAYWFATQESCSPDALDEEAWAYLDFAVQEGWPATVMALARAMREEERCDSMTATASTATPGRSDRLR